MRKVMLGLLMLLSAAPVLAKDYWVYIRTYDRPEVKINDTGGRSKKGDIVQVLDASIYKTPSEVEKKEWLILKVSNLTETQRNLMMTPWVEDVTSTGEAERTLTTAEWAEMQKTGNYYPFTSKPVDITAEYIAKGNTFVDKVQVKGTATNITQKTKAYRQYKLDIDTLKTQANIKIDTGQYDVKFPTGTIIPKIAAKTALDIAGYKAGAYLYALVTRPYLIAANIITRRAWGATTNTFTVITSGGGDYATMSAWEDARDGNIVTADYIEIANLSGTDADTTAVTIAGWTTGVNNYIRINGNNTTGKASTSHYRLSGIYTAQWGGCLTIKAAYTVVKNIEVTNFTADDYAGSYGISLEDGGDNSIIDGCIVHDPNPTAHYNHFKGINVSINGYPAHGTVQNCLVYNLLTSHYEQYGIHTTYNTHLEVYNNTVYNCSTINDYTSVGIFQYNAGDSGLPLLKNNLVNDIKGNCYAGTVNTASTNNLADDTTTPEYNTYYDSKNITFTNTSAGTEDFHLVSTDTDAIDKGADLSATFTTDIDGETILTGHWPIGADYLAAAAPPATPSGHKPRMNYLEWQLERGRNF